MLLSVASQVAPVAAPVVHTVVQKVQVPVTPEYMSALLNLAYLAVPGYLASFAHSVLKGKSQKLQADGFDWLNSALLFVYSFLIAAGVLYAQGNLDLHSPATFGAAFLAVLGAASLRYNALKLQGSGQPAVGAPAAQAGQPSVEY